MSLPFPSVSSVYSVVKIFLVLYTERSPLYGNPGGGTGV